MIDAFDRAFLAAIDDLNAGRLNDDPAHYLPELCRYRCS